MQIPRRDRDLTEAVQVLDEHFERLGYDVRKAFSTLSRPMQDFVDGEIERCISEPRYYLENYHVIKTEAEGLKTLFPFWEAQDIFFQVIEDIQLAGQPVRVVVLKARQLGLSTIAQGLIFHKTIFTDACNTAVIAQDPNQADYLFGMSRLAYNSLPWWMRPESRYEAKGRYLVFDRKDPTERLTNPGLNSQILVEAANKMTGVLVGKSIRAAHMSELSRWNNAGVLAEQIFPAMNAPDQVAILESTAQGRANFFHEFWKSAWDGKIAWHPVFIEFFRVKKYFLPLEPGEQFVPTKEEVALRTKVSEEHGIEISDGQFNWRRQKIQEFITLQGDEWKFYQEYPAATWLEAFQGSGLCAFNKRKLHEMLATVCRAPVAYGEITCEDREPKKPIVRLEKVVKGTSIPSAEEYGARLRIWEEPQVGETYYVAADVAHGVKGGDFSVAEVIRIGKKLEPDVQVAEWHGWINATPFGNVVCALGYWYNNAQVAIETNDVGMTTNNQLLRVLEYENLFRWKHYDKLKNFTTDFFGWATTHKSRDLIINKFREAMDEKTLIVYSAELIDECMDFSAAKVGARYEGQGSNDDRVMAMMIGNFCAHDSDYGQMAAAAPRVDVDPSKDYANSEYSPIHDKRGVRQQMFYDRKVPADYILLENLDSSSGASQDDDWKNL